MLTLFILIPSCCFFFQGTESLWVRTMFSDSITLSKPGQRGRRHRQQRRPLSLWIGRLPSVNSWKNRVSIWNRRWRKGACCCVMYDLSNKGFKSTYSNIHNHMTSGFIFKCTFTSINLISHFPLLYLSHAIILKPSSLEIENESLLWPTALYSLTVVGGGGCFIISLLNVPARLYTALQVLRFLVKLTNIL